MIEVIVVDDQFDSIQADLELLEGFQFHGVKSFDSGSLKEIQGVHPNVRVLLLDIMAPGNPEAGIELFEKLEHIEWWNTLKGSVQVVFFSDEATVQREFNIARSKRIDISGFKAKGDILRGKLSALDALRQAYRRAERYRDCPSLAPSLKRVSEIIYSSNSPSMDKVEEMIQKAGTCWEPVLIQGETGTGKELVAQAIDKVMKSTKWGSKKPPGVGGKMISYNIGSAPQEGNLQYTELFGAVKGAYSGCDGDRIGVFERASKSKPGSTIFLDEIGDAPHIVQVALLRVLQEKKIIPLGGFSLEGTEIERKVTFRLIAASHRDLPDSVEGGKFREDLYYRLNTIEIHIPPLRERLDDIPVLVHHFLEKLNKEFEEYGVKVKKVIPPEKEKDIFERLKSYSWPGNVRQLESFVRRSYVMSLGDEFVLYEDIERLIGGQEPSSRAVIEDVRKIKESLTKNSRSLPKLKTEYGLPMSVEVARLVIKEECDGRMPDEDQARKLFDMKRDACRKWMNTNGIMVGKVSKGGNISRDE